MRVIFMGTPDFAVGILEALVEAKHDVCLVVTQPDKPRGRGKEMQFTPVKEAALRYGIPVFQPQKVRRPECIQELKGYQADVMVVVAFGQILPKEILDMTLYGCVNVHASLLPKYRGAAPIHWAIIGGEKVTGVTTIQMDEGIDTGDMIQKTEVPISEEETGESLHDKLAAAGASLCVKTLKAICDGTAVFEHQGESTTPYAKMLNKRMGDIDWSLSAKAIERLVRGLHSWPSAYTHWDGKILKIWKAKAIPAGAGAAKAAPGTVLHVDKEVFMVQTGDGVLSVSELQIPGKKRMDTSSFLRGYTLEKGTVFTLG